MKEIEILKKNYFTFKNDNKIVKFCVGIRDANNGRRVSVRIPPPTNNDLESRPPQHRRLSEVLGIQKIHATHVELYVRNCGKSGDDEDDATNSINSVTFYFEREKCFQHKEDTSVTYTYSKHYPPFTLRKLVLMPCEFNFKVTLRDKSVHHFKQHFDLIHYNEILHECCLNISKIPREIVPSPLPSQKYYVEFDLLVPYPHSFSKSSSPQKIASFIANVSLLPCKFVGYYLDQYHENLSAKEKLFYNLSWKLALISVPLAGDRIALPLILKLKSPAVKGAYGLAGIARVLNAIESAYDKLKVLRQPGLRVGIDVSRCDLNQMKNLTRQYFKFYGTVIFIWLLRFFFISNYLLSDVFEDIIREYEDVDCDSHSKDEDEKNNVHLNIKDVLIQKVEQSHEFSMVGNYMGERYNIASLVDNASCVEELIEFACPVSSRSYRFSLRSILVQGHVEFRFRLPDIDIDSMISVVEVLIRFVAKAVVLPKPKMFKKCGQGKTLSMRREKFFKWLVQDKRLEEYFLGMQQKDVAANTLSRHSIDTIAEESASSETSTVIPPTICSTDSKSSRGSFVREPMSVCFVDPLLNSLYENLESSSATPHAPPAQIKPSQKSSRTRKLSGT